MDKVLKLYCYVDGINDTPFPSSDNHAIITSFKYDSKRMGGAPTISATLMHEQCLDKLWEYNVYATFNGEKYFIKNIPSSSYSNTEILYKHEIELVSERIVLDNVYFYDVVSKDVVNDKPVSNNSKFTFFGDIHEFASRLNYSLQYSKMDYTVVVDDGISSEGKFVSFEDTFFSNAIQESYNTYEIPYYFDGKTIHFGFTNNAITQTFKYGADESLLSIQKQNANYKVVNRVTGTGSADNIPYYYPNLNEWGIITAQVGWDKEGAGYDWDFSKESNLELKVSDVIIVDEEKFATKISPDDRVVCYGFKWHRNTINGEEILLDDIGIKIINHDGNQGCPNSYFWFGQKRMGYAMPLQSNLMPPIYRSTEGEERFYNALNNTYISPETGTYYEFENQYTDGKQKEQIVNFEDIKPSIVGMTNANGQRMDTFLEFAYDENDNDETDEEGNYLHPYFFAKLPKYDGTYGFNLFDHAIDEEEMTISMTSGNCGACEWMVMVDSETLKNTVQVDSNGNLLRDKNGNVSFGAAQDRQNDTINNEVWIALKKDIDTFGVVMPNATNNYKPSAGDTFVILHILLPNSYIFAAENRLKDELIKYMAANNSEKFNFSISFSRIYFAEHTDVLEKLNENSRIQIEYNGELHELYVSSFSYSMDSNSPLPNVTVELSDTLTIQKNALQTAISQVENSIMKNIGSIDWLKLGLAYFLRKDTDDRSRGKVSSDKGFEVGKFVSGTSGAMIYLDKLSNKTVAEVDKIYVRLKAYFEQLEIINENSIGGKQIISPAGSIRCKSVETKDDINYYRCYILTEQDGDKIENRFKVGDQASCQMFNAKEGIENNISNRYYWRLVVGVGEDYIDLSKSDCDTDSDEPMPNDVICHRGNRNDIDRQNFIEFSSVDSFSPSITLYQGVNNYSLTDKEVIQFGVNKVTGKSFMNVYGDMYVGNRDGSSFIQYTPENGLILKGTLDINTNFGNKTLKDTINEAGNAYKEDLSSLQSSINKDIDNLQSQIDGAIETWFFDPTPTLTNSPASTWTTDEDKNKHLGDLYYSGEGRAYRFQLNSESGSYYWNEIVDTDINKALENAKKAQDTADGKRRVFVSQPTNSQAYDIGDIWVNATYPSGGSTYNNDMLRANSKKAEGEPFSIEHWTLASKYTDDTVANEAQAEAAKANKAVEELDSSVRSFKNTVETTFRDGIISESEAQSLGESISQIGALKEQVTKSYDDMSSNSLLIGTTSLTNLSNAKSAFIVSCDELVSAVTSAISDKNITEAERALVNAKYDVYNTKYGDYNKALSACIRYVEETLNNNISSYNYLKKALKESTTISGGLVQTSAVVLGYTNDSNDYVVMAGTNGVVTSKGNRTPAFWMGGDMVDLFDVYNSVTGNFNREEGVRYATGMDRMDGTGYRANGNLWWDNDGKIHADPLSFFVGDNAVGGLLAAIHVVFKSDGIHPDYLIPQVPFQTLHIADRLRIGDALLKYDPVNKAIYATHVDGSTDTIGFYSEGWVSAKGANPSSGGGSGASALYQLLDVLPNAGNDGVFNAVKGSVLTYNGTKWQAGTIHVPTNLSEFTNDSGFITSAAIPTKLSAFTNDSGFITSAAIPTSLKNPYALKFGSQSYDGSSAKTITASDLGALTSHQSIYQLTIKANDATVLTFTPNSAAGSIAFVAGSNISLSADATNKKITIANTYSYTHPSGGANVTIAAAVGKVLGAITVNSLGHVTSVSAKTLVAADVTDLADVLGDYATITYVNDELAYTNETVSALVEKVNNFLEGTDTDGIINKWKELEAFLAGQTQTSTLADLLNVKAFASTKIIAGTGLTGGGDLTADRTLSLAASGVTAGTYPKVTVDQYGRVTAGSSLLVDDIPNLPWSKITSGKPTTLTGYGITDGVNSVKVSGSGNAVTAASVSGHVLTLTKGVTFLPQSSFDDLFEKVLLEDGKTYAIRAKYGFYSDSFVSAKGLNPSSSGGGSGASALYQLLDVVPNSTGTGVLNAVSGAVLMYNGSKWQAGIISVPNALSQLTNDAGFITSAALPTKVSQLNNDAGYITSVNSSMVISALGYTPYNSTNPNGYITGITKSMVEGVLTGNITSHTHSQYLTEHQSIYSLTFNAGTFIHDIYTPNSEAKTINIPTTTSHILEGNNLYFTNQRAVNALSSTLLGYQPLISDLEIIRNSASEGHTAYGWGNHANAGYLTGINSTMVVNALGYTPYNSSNPNGYISGITKAMVENVLTGNITSHSHTFASITSKPTTIAGYGITDALTTSNYNSYCPSLTGTGASGTWGISITGNAATATNADTVDGYHATDLVRAFWTGDPGYNGNTHNSSSIVTFSYSNNTPYTGVFIDLNSNGYGIMFNTTYYNDTQLAYRRHGTHTDGGMGSWRYLIDDTTIGSQSVNYANSAGLATKLQTPRTIWGQSFDGTSDISGSLYNTGTITASSAGTYDIGSNDFDYRYGYFQWIGAKSNTNLRLAANNSDNQIVLLTNGNVGIGTYYPLTKLHVVGGRIRCEYPIFGHMYGTNKNAAAFVWDKPGSYSAGVGSEGTTDTIRFSACTEDGTWADYTQNWKFYGNIVATGAITAKASSSDIRLKKDISSYSAIDIIRGHKSIKYHWNDVAKANSDVFKDDDWHYGLIAQEMQEDMPQMVSDVFKDYLVINYERLIPICWKGLQEVDDEVSRLKKEVRKLEKEIRELKQGA